MSLAKFGNLFDIFGYTMLYNFVTCLDFFNIWDWSATDESLIDETRVWRIKFRPGYFNGIFAFTTTGSMPLLVDVSSPRVSPAQSSVLLC